MKKKRKKLTKRQRSIAAKKGWETRRRNKRKMPKPVKPKKVLGEMKEYALKFDYTTKRKGHVIDVEVHIWGPVATKKEVKQVYEHWFKTGETEEGWRVKAIKWRHGQNQHWSKGNADNKKESFAFALEKEPTDIEGI